MLANWTIAHARAAASRVLGAAKAVLVNLESLVGDTSTDEPLFGALGVVARPKGPVSHKDATGLKPEGECEVICLKNEDGLQPVASRDLRINARTNPAEGEVMLAGYDGGFVSIKTASNGQGSQLVMLAPALNGSGAITTSHALVLDPGTQNAVSLVHRSGHGLLLTSAGNAIVKNAAGDVYMQASGSALTLNGNTQVVGGMVVSPGVPTPQPVMLSTDLLTWIGQANAWISQAQTAFAAIAAASGLSPNPTVTAPTSVPNATPVASTKLSAAP